MQKVLMGLVCMIWGLAPAAALGQESPTDAGVYSLSGGVSYDQPVDGSDTNYQLTIAPRAMYFVARDFAIGASASYSHWDGDDFDRDRYSLGPAIRWYAPTKSLKLFVSGALLYGRVDYDDDTGGASANYWQTEARLGWDFFLARNVALETSIGYLHMEVDQDNGPFVDSNASAVDFQIGINVFVF